MNTYLGWLLQLYAHPEDGLVLWLLDEEGPRRRLAMSFALTWYAQAPAEILRALWREVQAKYPQVVLARVTRRELHHGPQDVLALTIPAPFSLPEILKHLRPCFPTVTWYDTDIPLSVRFAAAYGAFPLTKVQITVDDEAWITAIASLEDPWMETSVAPSLRILRLEPEGDPTLYTPQALRYQQALKRGRISLTNRRAALVQVQALLKRHDPDLLLTRYGDNWLLPWLREGRPLIQLNRDPTCIPQEKKGRTYQTYGQTVYRPGGVTLFGRLHVDMTNTMQYAEYGLAGVCEMARVTGLGLQEGTRRSPGAGLTACQMQQALQEGLLIPGQQAEPERAKTTTQLAQADRGGLIGQPSLGVHRDVVELDFVSMYPSLIVQHNLSPEMVGRPGQGVPGLKMTVAQHPEGFLPQVLRPLLTRRLQLKARLTQLDPRDCRYAPLKAQVAALKWLLVVSYGYLGYPHARFGAQAAHEAVTAWGREHMLRAKEAAEDAGWRVLHMYVDGLWGQKEGVTAAEITALQAEVNRRTQLTLALEGVYRWLAFLPSRTDARIAVPNRYFGVFQDGRVKVRGLALRRRDTCNWVRTGQQGLLQRLAEAPDYPSAATLQTALAYLHAHAERLRTGQVPMAALVCAQTLSRPPEAYRVASSAAEVARQRRASGLDAFPGQTMRYVHTLGIPSITAWREQTALCPDQEMYLKRLARAAAEVLEPFGVSAAAILTSLTGVPSQKFLLNLQTQSDVLHKTNHRPL